MRIDYFGFTTAHFKLTYFFTVWFLTFEQQKESYAQTSLANAV